MSTSGKLYRSNLVYVATLLLVTSLASVLAVAAQRRPPQRIRFLPGSVSTQVRGSFSRQNERPRYVIRARKGDHMVVNIIPVTKGLTMAGTVSSPSGHGDGGPGGIIFNADLTEAGDYTIEAAQHTMGSNYSAGNFILEIVITPAWLKS